MGNETGNNRDGLGKEGGGIDSIFRAEKGINYGTDVEAGETVTIDISTGSTAQNTLITAGAGEGKSHYMKRLYMDLEENGDKYSTIVYDYEGLEYKSVGELINARTVNLTPERGLYVNTVVIGDITGDSYLDSGLQREAIEATERVFNVLVGEPGGMTGFERAIFHECLHAVYIDYGVGNDPTTWGNSQYCTYHHIYEKLEEIRDDNAVKQVYRDDDLNDFIIKLRPYFTYGGLKTSWFREPIAVSDVLDNQHVIINLGMGYGELASVMSRELRQVFAGYLTVLMAIKNKAQGRQTVLIVEDLQRYLDKRYSGEVIAGFSTRGRLLGMALYCVVSSPIDLLGNTESEDAGVRANTSTFLSNITTLLIGALWTREMDVLIRHFGLEKDKGSLHQLSATKEHGDEDGRSNMEYCFYINHKGQSTYVKMLGNIDVAGRSKE